MSNITELIKNIRNAVFGKDVRESIASAIEQTYEDASENGNANMEVTQARGSFDTLKKRLDNSDNVKANTIDVTRIEKNLKNQISSLSSGSPKGSYGTVQALITANPSTGVYIVQSDGHIYSWIKDAEDAIDLGNYRENITNIENEIKKIATNKHNFKTANDYQVATLNPSGNIAETMNSRIVLTNICTAETNLKFSITSGFKYSIFIYNPNNSKGFETGWITETTAIPKGFKFRVIIANINDTEVDTSIYENLWVEEVQEFYYGKYNEQQAIKRLNFILAGLHTGGTFNTYSKIINRCMSLEFLRYSHKVKVKNISDDYGFCIEFYNDDGSVYNGENSDNSATWSGTTKEVEIAANTTFRIYLRNLNNSDISDIALEVLDMADILQIEVNTYDSLIEYVDNNLDLNNNKAYSLATNNYYAKLKSNNNKRFYLDEWINFNAENTQSLIFDVDRNRVLKIDSSTTAKVYDYKGNYVESFTKPNTEHDNDACYVRDGIAYVIGGYYSINYIKSFFKWDIVNNIVTEIDLTAIENNSNGSYRVVAGVCETYRNSDVLYIVCADWYNDGSAGLNHQTGDKLSVYTYDTTSEEINLVFETDWDCVYIQGATCINDILYVACNTQTTNASYNYKGITIKMFDTKTWTLIDEYIIEGDFEPESLNYIIENGIPKLAFGIGKYRTISKLMKMQLPI